VLHDREVVRDEHVREVVVPLQVLEQVDHLCLHGDIEGRHGLVADDELGLHRESTRDPDALTLSARKLVRVPIRVLRPQAHFLEQLPDARVRGGAFGELVNGEPLADDRSDSHARVE
jgi:hypothetical protein